MNYTNFHSVKSPNLPMLAGGSVMLSRANSILSKGANMKKNVTCQQPRRRRPEIDAALGKDLGTFLRILTNLSGTLRDLGYPEESDMLLGVKTDILQRLQDTLSLPN